MSISNISDVELIIDYENGDLSPDMVLVLFSRLIKSGQAWTLQGSYGRMATSLIDNGFIDKKGKILKELELLNE